MYYQADVLMIPHEQIEFAVVSTSYGSTILLLATVLRVISRSITLHMTHLVLRHNPFFGLPTIDVSLTSDIEAFCLWTGLDYAKWKEGPMPTEVDSWKWLTDVDANSLLGKAWKRLARPREQAKLTTHKGKPGDLERFIKWLRSTDCKWFDPDETPAPVSLTSSTSSSTSEVNPNLLDPENPSPLDPRAVCALQYWGKVEEYEESVERRRNLAREIAERQKRKVVNREKERQQRLASAGEGVGQRAETTIA